MGRDVACAALADIRHVLSNHFIKNDDIWKNYCLARKSCKINGVDSMCSFVLAHTSESMLSRMLAR